MDEKLIETKEEQQAAEKKVYAPPTLSVYGKLTELTAGGTGPADEGSMTTDKTRHP